MTNQQELVALLKQKGTGQTMSKQLEAKDLDRLTTLLTCPDVHLVTKSTILTAMIMLPATDDEAQWLAIMKRNPRFIPEPLHCLFQTPDSVSDFFLKTVLRVMKGEDLSSPDFISMMDAILSQSIPDTLQASFLEAERLKRETEEENKACLDLFWEKSQRLQTTLPLIIDLAHPYDGFSRSLNLSVFIAMTLGKMGFPTLLHGMDETSPKNGITPYKILEAMGLNPLQTLSETELDLRDPNKGWGYCDQRIFFPELYALKTLRLQMVKRPVLSTIEKFLQPIRAEHGNYLFTGYTHPPYKGMTAAILSDKQRTRGFSIIRGTEGSAQAPLDRRCPLVTGRTEIGDDIFIGPTDFGLSEYPRIEADKTITVQDCVREGLDALNGKSGYAKDCIDYNCRAILSSFGLNQ